jgi:hypothetical protein
MLHLDNKSHSNRRADLEDNSPNKKIQHFRDKI